MLSRNARVQNCTKRPGPDTPGLDRRETPGTRPPEPVDDPKQGKAKLGRKTLATAKM